MGDMADWYLNQAEEAYLNGEDHEHFDEDRGRCKYCGKDDLHWVELPTGWRLENDDGEVHHCQAYWDYRNAGGE